VKIIYIPFTVCYIEPYINPCKSTMKDHQNEVYKTVF
jgi:hypothetical protein